MTDTIDTAEAPAVAVAAPRGPAEPPDTQPVLLEAPLEDGLLGGRPVEDRAFEAVEGGMGLLAGAAIGTAVAGPVGTIVGGIIGAAGGFLAGEALERHEGHVAETTDADPNDYPWTEVEESQP